MARGLDFAEKVDVGDVGGEVGGDGFEELGCAGGGRFVAEECDVVFAEGFDVFVGEGSDGGVVGGRHFVWLLNFDCVAS